MGEGVASGPKANNEEGCNSRRPTMLQWPEADKAMAGGRQINIFFIDQGLQTLHNLTSDIVFFSPMKLTTYGFFLQLPLFMGNLCSK